MRSNLQRRIISLLAVVAFGATGAADAYGLHSCPHHDALPANATHVDRQAETAPATNAHASSHATHASSHGVEHAGVDHDAAGHGLHGTKAASSDHDSHGPCSCVGECSANTPAAPLEAFPATIDVPLGTSAVVLRAQARPHPRSTPYLLPWANAPPVSASR